MNQLNKTKAIDTSAATFTYSDFVLWFNQGGLDSATVEHLKKEMIKAYVDKHFKGTISQLGGESKYKKGKWRARYYEDGIRKEFTCRDKDDVYQKLYEYYKKQEVSAYTLSDVFNQLMEEKVTRRNRSEKTVIADKSKFKPISETLKNASIMDITVEDIQEWIVGEYLPLKPNEYSLRKAVSIMSQCFEFGVSKGYCSGNPAEKVCIYDYLKSCTPSKSSEFREQFSEEQVALLVEDGFAHSKNTRALMKIAASDTGMRRAEICSLEWDDIDWDAGLIHVHSEQLDEKNGNTAFLQKAHYTKDQRTRPRNGRYIPILDNMREVLRLAALIPGDSKYVFHDPNIAYMISTNSYSQYLKRNCKSLGIEITKNHAFRRAFNNKLIRLGFSPDERAYIMGHSVEVNERYYSNADTRRATEIRDKLFEKTNTGL